VQIWGLNPAGHHLTNILLHVANALLLLWFLKNATGALWRSAMLAALFALHPLRVESVAWIAERKDVLSTFFLLLSINAYWRHVQMLKRDPFDKRFYYLALLLFAIGLMAKSMLVTLPCVLLLLDIWPLERISRTRMDPSRIRQLLVEKIPFFALSFIVSLVTLHAQKMEGAVSSLAKVSFAERLENTFAGYCGYIAKMLWPTNLAVLYPIHPVAWQQALVSAIVLLIISAIVVREFRRRPYFAIGWFWFLGMLVPVIGIVQVGAQSMADRYSYMPTVGLFICIVWGCAEFSRTFPRQLPICLGAIALIACAGQTLHQLTFWKNSISLFEHTISVTQKNFIAENNVGTALVANHRTNEGIQHFERALEIHPAYHHPYYNLGKIYGDEGKTNAAIENYEKALQYSPSFVPARYNLANILLHSGQVTNAIAEYEIILRYEPDDVHTLNNLGLALQQVGQVNDAIVAFQEAVRIQPNLVEGQVNLAAALRQVGKIQEAIVPLRKVAELQPKNPEAHFQLAKFLATKSHMAEAIEHFEKALQLKPDWPEAMNFLAHIFAGTAEESLRNGPKALQLAQRACALKPNDPYYMDTLAAAHAATGNFKEAVRISEEAEALAQKSGKKNLADQIHAHLELFKTGNALREF
jgi:tetratricopeptide (TPR) repeat protein